jgi:hypothetical protein
MERCTIEMFIRFFAEFLTAEINLTEFFLHLLAHGDEMKTELQQNMSILNFHPV